MSALSKNSEGSSDIFCYSNSFPKNASGDMSQGILNIGVGESSIECDLWKIEHLTLWKSQA